MPQPTCLQLKVQLAEIQSLFREFALALGKVRETRQTESLLKLQKEMEEKIESMRENFFVTWEKALKIMEKNGQEFFLGPDDIEATFGFKLEAKDIPKIPFSQEEIERHQELGDMLVLNVNKTPDGIPLTIEEMIERAMKTIGSNVIERDKDSEPIKHLLYKGQFDEQGKLKSEAWFSGEAEIKKQTPRLGWQFVSPNILSDSTDKNYLAQIEFLMENARTKFFNGTLPPEYQQAETQFQQEKAKIQQFIQNNNYGEASKVLSDLKISQLLREPMQNTLFRYLVAFKKGQQLFTDGKYSWSNSSSTDGSLLFFGVAVAEGAFVGWYSPTFSGGSLGAVSSRF